MAATKPVDLCTQLLPSGKLCRGVALRNQRHCRAHIRNHRILERERRHDEAMFRLLAELEVLSLPELLQTLETKLNSITRIIVRTYPEARQTLAFTIDRLADLNAQVQQLSSPESIASPQVPQNQSPHPAAQPVPGRINHLPARSPNPNT
jgi:hypothetical protein